MTSSRTVTDRNLRTQRELAERALARFNARVDYGSVSGAPGLLVTIESDDLGLAQKTLERFGVSAPVEFKMSDFRSYRPKRRAKNFLGGGLLRSSIHPPPDPSLRVLDVDARAFWDDVFEEAYAYYSSSGAPKPKEVAERTAWRAVRMHWGPSGRMGKWSIKQDSSLPSGKKRIPDSGKTIILGKLLEYVWINENGSLDVRRWTSSPPDLHWDQSRKCLCVYPNVPDQVACGPIPADMRDEAALYQEWSQRPAKCAQQFSANIDLVRPMGVGDSVAYRSDKWHDRSPSPYLEDSQEYFHQFSDGNVIWQDSDTSPNAIMMQGGNLAVIDRGIIH
jgi:hypothetical protein